DAEELAEVDVVDQHGLHGMASVPPENPAGDLVSGEVVSHRPPPEIPAPLLRRRLERALGDAPLRLLPALVAAVDPQVVHDQAVDPGRGADLRRPAVDLGDLFPSPGAGERVLDGPLDLGPDRRVVEAALAAHRDEQAGGLGDLGGLAGGVAALAGWLLARGLN